MGRRIERLDKSALRDTVVRMGERIAPAAALSTLMLLLMWPGPAGAQPATQPTQTFTSSANGYSIEFPADWTQVPDADV